MQIHPFKDIKHDFLNKGFLIVLFRDKLLACEWKCWVEDITDDHIIAVTPANTDGLKVPPLGQMLSALFMCEEGIFGFHAMCMDFDVSSARPRLLLEHPKTVWQIDRRQFPRVAVSKTILCDKAKRVRGHFEPCHQVHDVFLVNICRGGLSIQSSQKVNVGEYLYLLFDLTDKVKIDNLCAVVWSVDNTSDNRSIYPFTYGVRFVDMSSTVLNSIEDFVAQNIFLHQF